MAAHIHKGGPGVAGPVVVPFGAAYKSKGCVKAPAAVAAAIQKRPGAYYVNVHNAKYPAGALRGQLSERRLGIHVQRVSPIGGGSPTGRGQTSPPARARRFPA